MLTKLVILGRHRDRRHRAASTGAALARSPTAGSADCSSAPRPCSSPTRASSSSATTATTCTTPTATLPRSLYLSVAIVAAVYVGVTIGAQMLVSDQMIVARKEVAFVAVGRGCAGTVRPVGGDRRARSSRPARRSTRPCSRPRASSATPSASGELPPSLGRETDGLPDRRDDVHLRSSARRWRCSPASPTVIAFGSAAFLARLHDRQLPPGPHRADRGRGPSAGSRRSCASPRSPIS